MNLAGINFVENNVFPLTNLPIYQASLEFSPNFFEQFSPTHDGFGNLKSTSNKRKNEFIAGRLCVKQAFINMGVHPKPIPVTADGAPLWPEEIVGSISHTNNFAFSALARKKEISGLGIDTEAWIDKKRIKNVVEFVATKKETNWLKRQTLSKKIKLFTLLFSAKESVYKYFYSLTKTSIDFEDLEITIEENPANQFRFKLLKNLSVEFSKGYEGTGWYEHDLHRVYTLTL